MRRIGAWLAAAACGAAVGVVVPVTSASAAACPAGTGVTVVVGTDVRCDPVPGGSGVSNMRDTGHKLTEVASQKGFICRIDGVPADASCADTPPADAYWAIFVSSGDGRWSYATSGVSGLEIPAGGWIGFRFQTTRETVAPSVTPKGVASSGSGSSGSGGSGATGNGTGGATSGSNGSALTPTPGTTAGASATPGAEESEKAKKAGKSGSPSATPAPTGTPDPRFAPSAAVQPASESSSLIWVAAAIGLLLALGMGWVVWQRRAARP